MSFDEGLAERIREQFQDRHDVEEKEMFGGLCFMVSEHMCCGIVNDFLMARVGTDNYEACLNMKSSREMDFTGRSMQGFIYVSPEGIESDDDLEKWITLCLEYILSLPPKNP